MLVNKRQKLEFDTEKKKTKKCCKKETKKAQPKESATHGFDLSV